MYIYIYLSIVNQVFYPKNAFFYSFFKQYTSYSIFKTNYEVKIKFREKTQLLGSKHVIIIIGTVRSERNKRSRFIYLVLEQPLIV